MRALLLLLAVALVPLAAAQTPVSGRVLDPEGAPLPTATVLATRLTPDSLQSGLSADVEGRFVLRLAPGTWRLRISFVGYRTDFRELVVGAEPVDLGDVTLGIGELAEVEVDALRQRVEVRGDTTAYDAASYAVNPDATVEDLVGKLPGVTVQDGEVQARGERVQRVLVDGEEFFGSDPSAALRNLPAEIVQEIQVFDRQSDQSRFTGFDDGNAEVTINVVTRPDRRNGQFGRLFASGGGSGETARYSTGGAVHMMNGSRRVSVIGLLNNVNEQNFAAEDLVGVLDSGGGRGGRGGSRGGGRQGGGFRGGDAGTYLVSEQPGVTTTTALGVNYQDRFGQALRVQGSYFLNRTGNLTDAFGTRDYLIGEALSYAESNDATSTNWNHRFSGRLEATLSERTQLTVTPRLSLQTNDASSLLVGQSTVQDALTGLSQNDYASAADGLSSSASVLLRHRLATPGRTLSLGLTGSLDRTTSDVAQDVLTLGYDMGAADTTDAYQRQIDTGALTRRVSASLRYTEPLAERLQLQFSYTPSLATATDDADAFRLDPATGLYSVLDSTFTSAGDQRVTTHGGGLDLNYRTEGLRLSAGLDAEAEWLDYTQAGPQPFTVDRRTVSLLPSASAHYEVTDNTSLDLRYRARTRTPGVTQLRDVVDDTNALLVRAGNPDLQTAREHTLDLRVRATKPEAGSVLFGSVQLATTLDYVGQSVTVAEGGPLTVRGVTLDPGAQLTMPVNLDGYLRARAFGTVGRPISLLKSNVNLTAGATYTRTPSLYNDVLNRADALALDGRLYLGTNVSERFDASLSYGLAWTGVSNSSRTSADDTYLRHRAQARLSWLPTGGLNLTTDVNLSATTGLDVGTAPTTAVWNAGIGYKFLADDLAEVRLSVNDLLNRNATLAQNVTDTYIETTQSQALGRYVMLGVSYRLRAFGSAGQIPPPGEGGRGFGRRGDGPPRGGD